VVPHTALKWANSDDLHDAMVFTMKLKESKAWWPEARWNARSWIVGRVVKHSSGHGLCFQVQPANSSSEDTSAWYNPDELLFL
jgi:hypothetical protein